MPKIPSRETVTPELLVNNLQHTASSVKSYFDKLAVMVMDNAISAASLGDISNNLVILRRALAQALDHPDLIEFSVRKFGPEYATIGDDFQGMVDKLDATIAALHALPPTDKEGNLLLVRWDTDGTFAWHAFTPEDMAPLRALITEIAGNIDGRE